MTVIPGPDMPAAAAQLAEDLRSDKDSWRPEEDAASLLDQAAGLLAAGNAPAARPALDHARRTLHTTARLYARRAGSERAWGPDDPLFRRHRDRATRFGEYARRCEQLSVASGLPRTPTDVSWPPLTRAQAGKNAPGAADSDAGNIASLASCGPDTGILTRSEHDHLKAAAEASHTGDQARTADHLAQALTSLALRDSPAGRVRDLAGVFFRRADLRRGNFGTVTYDCRPDGAYERAIADPPPTAAQRAAMPVISGDGVLLPGSQAGASPETARHLDSAARDIARRDYTAAAAHLDAAQRSQAPSGDELARRIRSQLTALTGHAPGADGTQLPLFVPDVPAVPVDRQQASRAASRPVHAGGTRRMT